MRLTSIIVLLVATILGALAVFGVRAMLINNQRAANAKIPELGTVVVAAQPLEFGTEIQPEHLKTITWAGSEKPAGSFGNIDEILSGERRVALRSIAPGEPLLRDRVSGFGGRATLSQIIEQDKRAVTLRINDVSGAGGFVLPGDRVDVLSTIQPSDDALSTYTTVLLQDVRVLGIDQMLDDAKEGAVVAKAATLEVSPEDAQRVALASTIGTLSLTLRNIASERVLVDAKTGVDPRIIRYKDIWGKSQPEARRVSSTPRPKASAPAVKPTTTMRLLKGADDSTVEVLKDTSQSRVARAGTAGAGLNAATEQALAGGTTTLSRTPAPN